MQNLSIASATSFKAEKSVVHTCLFRKLPPELRHPVFREFPHSDSKAPALRISLRGDEKLCQEALEIFHQINFFPLLPSEREASNSKR